MNINREILRLTVPAVISNITVPLLALSDTTISGHLHSVTFLAAISMGSMMFHLVFWLFGFLRMGTTGLTAQAFGRDDIPGMRRIFSQAFLIALVAGILIIVLRSPLKTLLLGVMDGDDNTSLHAAQYFDITILSAPALLGTLAINGWLFGMQTTLLPMIISISVNVINIGLSLFFVFGTGIGFPGVAWGTFCANWLGLILALILAARFKGRRYLVASLREIMDLRELQRFFKVNGNIFLRSACIMAVSLAVTSFGARLGAMTLATNAVMMQFFILFSYFMDGLAFTAEALCGRFAGAGDRPMLGRSIRAILRWGAVLMCLFFSAYLLFYKTFAGWITDEAAVVENISRYSAWLIAIPPVTVAAFIFDGIFIGLTATGRMLTATVIASAAFFLICLVHLSGGIISFSTPDNNLIWLGFLSYLFLRGVILSVMTPSAIRNFYNRPSTK